MTISHSTAQARSTFSKNSAFKAGAIFARASTLNITDGVVLTRSSSFSQVVFFGWKAEAMHTRNGMSPQPKTKRRVEVAPSSLPKQTGHTKRNGAIDAYGQGGAIVITDASTLEVSHTVLFSGE
jgi:hypothetical protein